VKAMQVGAYHFVTKPVAVGKLKTILEEAAQAEPPDQVVI
jgi:DNA-binding NtrC family response regulator